MSKGQIILAAIIQVGFIGVSAVWWFAPESIPPVAEKPLTMIVGAWIVNFTTVVNFLFGSSKGSADKTSMLNRRTNDTQ